MSLAAPGRRGGCSGCPEKRMAQQQPALGQQLPHKVSHQLGKSAPAKLRLLCRDDQCLK